MTVFEQYGYVLLEYYIVAIRFSLKRLVLLLFFEIEKFSSSRWGGQARINAYLSE